MKKLFAILLSVAMIAAMALSAMAFTYSDDIPDDLGTEIFDFTGTRTTSRPITAKSARTSSICPPAAKRTA